MESAVTKLPTETSKPIVHYTEVTHLELYFRAFVCPTDHPSPEVSNTTLAMTSPVIRINNETGEFETENTIYRKVTE